MSRPPPTSADQPRLLTLAMVGAVGLLVGLVIGPCIP